MTFANPVWLLLLIPLPVLAIIAGIVWHRRGERWHGMVADRLRKRLSHQRPLWIYFTSLGLGLLGLAGLVIAYAQPESGEEWLETKNEGRNILLCVDISRSMLTRDVSPNRLLAARAAALDVVERFPTDRIGLLVFSGETQVQVPLTIDHTFIEQSLAQLNPIDLPIGGSDLAEALTAGRRVLVDTGQRSNVLVIFSDGEEFSSGLEDAAKLAADNGVFVYALGFGTKAGDFIPGERPGEAFFYDRNQNRVQSRLNEESLTMIARKTDGFYSRGIGPTFLRKLDRAMQEMDRFEQEGRHQRVAKPAYQWFLFSGILLLMSSFALRCFPLRSGPLTALALLMIPITPAEANPLFEGRTALREGENMKAHSLFTEAAEKASGNRAAQIHLAAGSAAFQGQSWSSAADSFSQALVSDDAGIRQQAHYSLATSLFYQGRNQEQEIKVTLWKGAIEQYEQALELDPSDQKSEVNLEAVRKLLKGISPDKKEQTEDGNASPNDQEKDGGQSEEQNGEGGQNDKSEGENQDEEMPDKEKGEEPREEGEDPSEEKEEGENPGDTSGDGKDGNEPPPEDPDEQGMNQDDPTNEDQNDGKNSPPPPRDSSEKDSKNNDPNNTESGEAQQEQAPEGESKEERARRLLRQHADFGGKPPKHRRRIPRRAEKDW